MSAPSPSRPRRPLPGAVVALGVVSFLTDASSEMIYPLLPLFLTTTLGASATMLGVIEGMAETTASLLKLASGWWSDRLGRRKPLVLAGYALASAARPLVALASSGAQVLAIRVTDRVGKGIRSAPRDALLADAAEPGERGRAFGFHRAMDHAGAVVGPLVAWALLHLAGVELRGVFLLAAIPGALAVLVLVLLVREKPAPLPVAGVPSSPAPATPGDEVAAPLDRSLRRFLLVVLLFTLGNSTDAFLLLRAADLGVPVALLPVLWAAFHVVKSLSSTPGGALSDRVGRRPLLVAGWCLYALVYAGFALAGAAWQAWALFGLYGLVFGLTEGTEKALVADLAGARAKGRAFGWYHLVVGLAALPASVLFGLLWDRAGAATAFGTGAALSLVATALLLGMPSPGRPRA